MLEERLRMKAKMVIALGVGPRKKENFVLACLIFKILTW